MFTPLWGAYSRQRTGGRRGPGGRGDGDRRPGRGRGQPRPVRGRSRPGPPCCSAGRPARTPSPALRPGDPVDVAWKPKPSDGGSLRAAVGGGNVLVRDGVVQNIADPTLAPRTSVGFSADGTQDDHADRGRSAGRQPRRHPDRDGPDDGRAGRAHRAEPRRRRLLDPARPGTGRGRRAGGEQPVGRHRTRGAQRSGRLRAAGQRPAHRVLAGDRERPDRRARASPRSAVAARTGSSPA